MRFLKELPILSTLIGILAAFVLFLAWGLFEVFWLTMDAICRPHSTARRRFLGELVPAVG